MVLVESREVPFPSEAFTGVCFRHVLMIKYVELGKVQHVLKLEGHSLRLLCMGGYPSIES